eukprot:TRINITY_DN3786_c0_g1_i3.p1 TRINITY_DN3786_c0_g1~~TRINITY_DN3786_c0_g1_i3.p1  ORF type:complete len:514 (-),score=147.05 TRINITY_DN3786_c0_g1_i3:81-1622(-)
MFLGNHATTTTPRLAARADAQPLAKAMRKVEAAAKQVATSNAVEKAAATASSAAAGRNSTANSAANLTKRRCGCRAKTTKLAKAGAMTLTVSTNHCFKLGKPIQVVGKDCATVTTVAGIGGDDLIFLASPLGACCARGAAVSDASRVDAKVAAMAAASASRPPLSARKKPPTKIRQAVQTAKPSLPPVDAPCPCDAPSPCDTPCPCDAPCDGNATGPIADCLPCVFPALPPSPSDTVSETGKSSRAAAEPSAVQRLEQLIAKKKEEESSAKEGLKKAEVKANQEQHSLNKLKAAAETEKAKADADKAKAAAAKSIAAEKQAEAKEAEADAKDAEDDDNLQDQLLEAVEDQEDAMAASRFQEKAVVENALNGLGDEAQEAAKELDELAITKKDNEAKIQLMVAKLNADPSSRSPQPAGDMLAAKKAAAEAEEAAADANASDDESTDAGDEPTGAASFEEMDAAVDADHPDVDDLDEGLSGEAGAGAASLRQLDDGLGDESAFSEDPADDTAFIF